MFQNLTNFISIFFKLKAKFIKNFLKIFSTFLSIWVFSNFGKIFLNIYSKISINLSWNWIYKLKIPPSRHISNLQRVAAWLVCWSTMILHKPSGIPLHRTPLSLQLSKSNNTPVLPTWKVGKSAQFWKMCVKVSYTRACQTVWFANQMHVCVDGTANLRCAIREWFAYRSLRTKFCQFFAQTQRELDAPGVLSTNRVSFARLRFAEN